MLPRRDSLRIALVVDSPEVPRWVIRAVMLARNMARASVDVLASVGQERSAGRRPRPRAGALRRLYDRFDSWRFPVESDSLDRSPLDQLAGWRAEVVCPPDAERLGAALEPLAIDAIVWLADSVDPASFVHLAPCGIWQWRFGQGGAESAVEPSFHTVLADSPVIVTRLTALLPGPEERTLAASLNNSIRFSGHRTEASVSWQAARLLPRAISNVLTGSTNGENPATASPDETLPARPRPGLARQLVRLGLRYAQHRLENARRMDQWSLAFHRGAAGDVGPAIVPGAYTDLIPPPDREWADPFPVREADVDWVFFEEFVFSRKIGHLSVAPLGVRHFTARAEPIIVEGFHLSYPFVFRHEGQYYLIPETAEQQMVHLYRAVRFPYEWQHERVIMEGPTAVDPTLVRMHGRWWLFAADVDDGVQPWSELHVFHSDSPFGPWIPHQRNPVVADVSHARPAGRIFCRDGSWYRPSQDCSLGYGHALSVRRIDVLTPTEFRETIVSRLEPTWEPGLRGVHTLNGGDGLTLIDVRRRVWRRR